MFLFKANQTDPLLDRHPPLLLTVSENTSLRYSITGNPEVYPTEEKKNEKKVFPRRPADAAFACILRVPATHGSGR